MAPNELDEIIENRLRLLGMQTSYSIIRDIVQISQGFPGYTHLLAQAAARSAIARRSVEIEKTDLSRAMQIAIDKSDATIQEKYAIAVRSTKPDNQYRQALLGCAMAATDRRGYFNASAVKEPFSRIMGRDMDIPNYARHLAEFCAESRGPTLIKEGKPKSFEYKFCEPLLKPFVLMNGYKEGLLPTEAL